jgi:hypothetical protein
MAAREPAPQTHPQIWRHPPRQVAEIGLTALRKLLGQAHLK